MQWGYPYIWAKGPCLNEWQKIEMFLYALILDSIEANVEQAQNYVEGANVQLSKASVYQVRQRLRIKKI